MQENRCGNKLGQRWIGRLISVFLVLTMFLGIMPVSVFAAQDSDTLSDIPGISTIEDQQSDSLSDFYNVEDITTLSDDEAASTTPKNVDGVYQIGTAAELTWFASAVNDGTAETQNAVLTANIDLNNVEWKPIGTTRKKYTGTFNGQNNRVTGLYISTPDLMAGLFGFADTGSKIENLTVAGNISISNFNQPNKSCMIGGIVAVSRGDIINCHNEVNISLTDYACKTLNVGGICGSIGLNGTVNSIVGCTNVGDISCSVNPGSTDHFAYAGGIAGRLNFNPKVDSCKNTGSVSVALTGFGTGCAGGITNLSYVNEVDINNCYNTGSVQVTKPDSIGDVTLCAGAVVGYSPINETTATICYPTNCYYLSGSASAGMNNANGQAVTDETSGISAKTADELKSTEFLASLNAAAPITNYTVTWIAGADGYPTIKHSGNGEPQNTAPHLKSGVAASATASVPVNTAYTLDLSTIFEDDENNALTYKVKIDSADAVAANQNYSYTPTYAGETILVFTANDGKLDSKGTYTVTLSAAASSNAPQVVEGAYQIGTAAELTWFATAINEGTAATQNAVLTKDIDLQDKEWKPIGTTKNKYTGTFDGQHKRVSGLKITTPDLMAGLFGYTDSGSKIENLTVAGNISISNFNQPNKSCMIGGIVAVSRGDIINCHNEVNISLTDYACKTLNVGGICGSIGLNGTVNSIVGCTNVGDISCSVNPGSTDHFAYAGGIAGRLNFNPKVDSCKNTGSVSVALTGFGTGCAGGITNLSYVNEVDINNCYNTGSVQVTKPDSIGDVTLCAGAVVGYSPINETTATICYPTNCYYLSGSASAGMNSANGQAVTDATSGISAKTAEELKAAGFLAALNSAAPITDYTVTWVAGAKGYPAIDNVQAAAGIKSFTVAGVNATIDQKAHTITAELPAGTDLTTLVPTIVCFANTASTPASGVAQNFTKPVTYTAGGVSYTVTLTVAEPDFLGSGTQDEPYQVNSPKLLLKLSTEYNKDPASFAGKYWKQTAEIDMTGVKFTPIGVDTAFSGTYDGNNFTIKNLKIDSGASNVGLFGVIGNGATIKNVVLDSSCTVSASTEQCKIGGIAGYMNASGKNTIENCVNHAAITCSAPTSFSSVFPAYAGGIVGEIASSKNNLVIGCKNYGTVKQTTPASYCAGGIAGLVSTNAVVANCENHGEVLALSAVSWTGATDGSVAGGIAAKSKGYISGCYNDGAVTAGMYVGGIVGDNAGDAMNQPVIESCYNAGTVAGNSEGADCSLGGIAGSSLMAILNKCYNVGTCTPHKDSNTTKCGLIVGDCRIAKELSGNYFLGTELSQGYGAYTTGQTPTEVMMMPVTDAWLKSGDAVTLLNSYPKPYSLYKVTWADSNSYPVFSKVEKILSHYKEIKTFTVTIDGTTYEGTISGTDISIVLPAGVTSITPNITISDNATISPASGTAVTLKDGTAAFRVTAENGDTATYTLHATIPGKTTGLAALQVYTAQQTLLAASSFKQDTTEYTTEINDTNIVYSGANSEILFKVIPATSTATVTAALNGGETKTLRALTNINANGNSGYLRLWSSSDADNRPVLVGENTVTITVKPADTGDDESNVVTYTLKFTVVPTLSSLTITGNGEELSLNKTFNANEFEYTMEVPDDVTELTISAVARMTGKAAVTLPQGASDNDKLDISNLDKIEIKVGDKNKQTTYTITLTKRETYSAQIITDPTGAAVSVISSDKEAVTPDANGIYKLLVDETYTIKATKPGYITATKTISSKEDLTDGKLTIKLTPVNNPLPDYGGDWTSFRGSDTNMAIVNAPTPMNTDDVDQYWVVGGSGSYADSITQPLIINGYLYAQSGKKVLKIDPTNGEVKATGNLIGSSTYTTNPLGYGDGMIFAAIDSADGGCIQALNAETLAPLWTSKKISGQMISPITYHNGYIYTGTWNSETAIGTYFALPVTDQNTSSTNETQDILWRVTHKGGFYWAGAYATDKYVVFGSDDGANEGSSSASATLYSVDPLTGRKISTLTGIVGDIRSTIAYDNGYVYFTTKGGYLYKAKVSTNGELSDLQSFQMANMATATPIVYDGVAFITCANSADQFNTTGTVYAINVNTMEKISTATTPAYVQASMLLSTAYESSGKLYLYAANNFKAGTISVITYDKTTETLTCADLYNPAGDVAEHCICALICDANGTIYFKNDSGARFAIRSKAAEAGHAVTILTTQNGTVTADKQRAAAGEIVTVTVTPALGYQLKSLTMNDQPLTVTNGKATFTMPDTNAVLEAIFEKSTSAVDDLRQAMEDLTITDASKATYDAIEAIKAARNNLTAAEKADIEDDYKAFLQKAEAFNTYLEAAKQAAIKEINDYVNGLDKKKYSDKNWKKITELQSTAIRNINKALYEEEIDSIKQSALDAIKAVKAGEISVTFRLIGALEATQDVDLTKDSYLPEYVTWIPTTTYSLDAGAKVYDVFMEALKDAGLSQIGADNNYVKTIYAPSCLGGYALSEFTNGKKSGWMYTVNGTHPNQGLKNWTLNDNDVVVWHYVNDYSHEVADWFNDPNYPSLGNGTYYNGWLRAADIAPEQYVQQLLAKILTVGKHGTVEPKLTFQHIGKSVTFTFKPDTGYKVKDVKVNGKSVGAVKTYTIDKLTVSTRIEVEFTNGKLPFTDVRESDWFYEDVAFAYENGLFAGTSDTTFSPNASMTRAMLVTVLYRLEGQPAVNGRSGFSDVQYNGYYEDAVTWAADNGIVNGTSTTTFSPNANVTREQMAAILYRYAQYKKYNTAASSSLNGFTDHASVSGYAAASLEWAVAEKLVNGSAGKLMPTGNATRAQVAAILHRFVENVAKTTN